MCHAPRSEDDVRRTRFRYSLLAADGSVLGDYHCARPLTPGDLVSVPETREVWRVDATLGRLAHVRPPADGEGALVRVSASTAAAARALAAELGAGACCGETPNGWVVFVRVAEKGRVATLTTVAAAARRVGFVDPGVEFFVLGQGRPVRGPPPL